MRLGMLGGTFNPIHRCHLTIATEILERLSLDKILFIPSGDPPHKPASSLAPAIDRYEMVKRAIASESRFAISDIEITRPSVSYSIDTVRSLRSIYSSSTELSFIIGLDAFLDFPTWRDAKTLFPLCHFVVVSRPNVAFTSLATFPLLPAPSPETQQALRDLDNGTRRQYELATGEHARLILISLPPCPISASDIRQRIRTGASLGSVLPQSVESYIIERGLYKENDDLT